MTDAQAILIAAAIDSLEHYLRGGGVLGWAAHIGAAADGLKMAQELVVEREKNERMRLEGERKLRLSEALKGGAK